MTSKEALENMYYGVGSEKENNENYMIIKQDLELLEMFENNYETTVKRNKELIEKNEKLSSEIDDLLDDKLVLVVKNKQQDMFIGKLIQENEELKQAIEILKDILDIKLEIYHNGGCTLNHKIISNCITSNDRCLRYLEVEQYDLLNKYLGKEQKNENN